jgi:hypothetical protein
MLKEFSSNGVIIEEGNKNEKVLNKEVELTLIISKCKRMQSGIASWTINLPSSKPPDFTILARLNSDNKTIKDYYIFPRFDIYGIKRIKMKEDNGFFWDMFRFDRIDWFFECFGRIRLGKER